MQQLLLLAKSRKQSGPEFLWQVLSSQGKKVVTEGKTLETEEENLAYLRTAAAEFERDRLPILTLLGIS